MQYVLVKFCGMVGLGTMKMNNWCKHQWATASVHSEVIYNMELVLLCSISVIQNYKVPVDDLTVSYVIHN